MGQWQTAGHAADDRYDRLAVERRLRPAESGSHNRGNDQGQEHVELRQMIFARQFSEHDDQDNRSQSDAEGARIHVAAAQREPDAVEHMLLSGAAVAHAGQVSQLR